MAQNQTIFFSQPKNLGAPLPLSRLAQLVERKTLNLVVVGSSPTVGVTTFSLLRFFVFLDMKAGIAKLRAVIRIETISNSSCGAVGSAWVS